MAEPIKNVLNEEAVRWIAGGLLAAYPKFPRRDFEAACFAGLGGLELTPRAWHIANHMHGHLPQDFAEAANILIAALGEEIPPTGENGLGVLRYMPHVFYVQKYGTDHFEPAMRAQYELTKRFSAESSIRVFIERYPHDTYERLLQWASDANTHVRRLVSEGTRPRLPWAPRLRGYQKNPRPVIALLEILRDDPERYVQRSVANNLNDIGKDHPDLAVEICRKWLGDATPGRAWIVKHALRSLVKKGHRGALEMIGAGGRPEVKIGEVKLDPAIARRGGQMRFSFELTSTAKRPQNLLVDFAVHFVKANGATKPKVFKMRMLELEASATAAMTGSISFANMTTRKHYPGCHRIELLINGMTHPLAGFEFR